jgi:large subunit ribosomal protein L1
MDKKQVIQALEDVKNNSTERRFRQRYELIINLKDLNIKKTEEQVDIYVELPHSSGKEIKICGLVGGELKDSSKKFFDTTITTEEFDKYREHKKDLKRIAQQHTFFVAQATIMPQVAKNFGRILGTQGKLPNPKAGCVVPSNADLSVIKKKLSRTVRIKAKTDTSMKCPIGSEKMSTEDIADNVITVYTRVKSALPKEEHNIKNVILKLTMGKPVKIESGKKK